MKQDFAKSIANYSQRVNLRFRLSWIKEEGSPIVKTEDINFRTQSRDFIY